MMLDLEGDTGEPVDTFYIRERFDSLMRAGPKRFIRAEAVGREMGATRIEILFGLLESYKQFLITLQE